MDATAVLKQASGGNSDVLVYILMAVATVLAGLLWWFIRDRWRSHTRMGKEKERLIELRDQEVQKVREQKEIELQRFRERLEQERHDALQNHYSSIENRLKAGTETFNEFKIAIQEFREKLQTFCVEFVSVDTFEKYATQQESFNKEYEKRFEVLKEGQAVVVNEMKHLGEQIDLLLAARPAKNRRAKFKKRTSK